MQSTAIGSPSLGRRDPKPRSPRKVLRQDAFTQSQRSASFPSVEASGAAREKRDYHTFARASASHTTFHGNTNSIHQSDMIDHDDAEDPHDLAFPKTHFARASMVDSLVMSLDQFSPTSTNSLDYHSTRSASIPLNVTSDKEVKEKSRPGTSIRSPQADTFGQSKDDNPLAGIFRDEEDSHRAKVYNAQRAMQPPTIRSKTQQYRPGARSRGSSTSSSVDLGHLTSYAGRLGPAGNRRSQSFDFGSTQRKPPSSYPDSAPNAGTFVGSTLQASPGRGSGSGQTVDRPGSEKTTKPALNKKRRSGTIGAQPIRFKADSPQILPPTKNFTADSAERKSQSTPRIDSAVTPRPGFFKRVFGSSRNSAVSNQSNVSPASRVSQDRSASAADFSRPGTPPGKLQKPPSRLAAETPSTAANRENQSVVTKKPSSFFRRRKKSVSTNLPPSLPLSISSNLRAEHIEQDVPSPVSSLKAIMDPWLASVTDEEAARHRRGSSLQSVQNAAATTGQTEGNKAETRKAGSDTKGQPVTSNSAPPGTSNLSKLQIPAKDALLPSIERNENVDRNVSNTGSISTNAKPSGSSDPVGSPMSSKDDDLSPRFQTPISAQAQGQPEIPDRSASATSLTRPLAQRRPTNTSTATYKVAPSAAESDASEYKSAPSTPIAQEAPIRLVPKSPHVHVSHPSLSRTPEDEEVDRAKKIYENSEVLIGGATACAWLGEGNSDRGRVLKAYMSLFDWSSRNIMSALRTLCSKLALKGETQQVDRVLEAFALRWCECNKNHGFRSTDVVHTICYSLLLLNTDLHMADIGNKMTRVQFVRNAMVPIKQIAFDPEQNPPQPAFLGVRSQSYNGSSSSLRPSVDSRDLRSPSVLSVSHEDGSDVETLTGSTGPLVDMPYTGSQGGWELAVEAVLKDFYTSIARDPLPLSGQPGRQAMQSGNNMLGLSGLRRTPSTLSKAQSDRSRIGLDTRSLGARWGNKGRSRPRLGSAQGFGSSRTSLDDGSSGWSPMSSTWSKVSLGKTLTSMSVDSFGIEQHGADYQSSIGFANALSQAIIRDENMEAHTDDGIKAAPMLEDESLELHGAPWAKEGMLKHKCHLEGVDKRSKDRNWNDCFAVVEKGWMRLFSFSVTAKTLRTKAKSQKPGPGAVVGGGNWQDNAEEVWKFMLRHTIASSLPPPGYSKTRPYVWALSLPNGAVHLFSAGTPDIVKEFVSTANFWSARLSKEPMTGGVSSMEYGWSDAVINRSLIGSGSQNQIGPGSPRPSTQMSVRSSFDHSTSFRPRLPGDKVHISEWNPPQQSLMASNLMEVDQLKALQSYVKGVEDELQRHNELRGPMLLAFSSRHPNSGKAMSNWEKKSSYLLREIVKFGTYIDTLSAAERTKQKVYRMRREDEEGKRDARAEKAFIAVNSED